ncbi:hypothetical protein [Silvanigrella aquatica]|uniref:Uncharacterized protein n=1 Tax=Silvanigrella aquatica TaxID=1915309 RepID=A0A1L4D027_9BACT|nr:hypothetical protein [Silvanigrella aquatica]APJ03562.1 hypothetical protein AXG55_06430 [Silvanigrella aquatica]
MFLIFISCLVSLLTITILFFQVINMKQRKIPSWFFGKENKNSVKNKLSITKPPIIPIILIILITIAFSISYYPQKNAKESLPINKSALIWVDPSLQAKLSRLENKFSASKEAEKIIDLGYKNFGLKSSFIIQNGKPKINYELISLNSKKEIVEYFENQSSEPPSPFVQSIIPEDVSKILNNNENFNNKKNTLIVFSDGYIDSLQGLYALKKFFDNSILIKSPPYIENYKIQKEIIPTDLYSLWGEGKNSRSSFSIFDTHKSRIPEEARPHFFIKSYLANEEQIHILKSMDIKKSLPLFIGCTNRYPSPIELDSFSNLRTLVVFFGNDFIEKNCEKDSNELAENKSVWKYRNSTVWVVPINDQILSSMNDGLSFWIPEGFDSNYDTLVYTAGSNASLELNEENHAKKVPVQLDSGSYPLPLYLIPPPPGAELGVTFPDDSRVYKGIFKPFYNAADGTILAWKASSLPFFYLRTTTSTPNGELGRSRAWTHFWFEAANNLKQSNLSFIKIDLDDATKLNDKLEEAEINGQDKFLSLLDLNSLDFIEAKYFTMGLYKLEKKNRWVLFSSSRNEKNNVYVNTDEFNQAFYSNLFNNNVQNDKHISESLLPILSAILGSILLLFLWRKKNINSIALLLILVLFGTKKSYAQNTLDKFNFPFLSNNKNSNSSFEQENTPFRIAWCAKDIPEYTEKKYNELRTLLKRRGTIVLPNKLKANSCRPGEAEIWWTDNPSYLTAKNVQGHLSNGGVFILEGNNNVPINLLSLSDQGLGIDWESPKKRGMFYRSFYLLQSIDGCLTESTKILVLKKKINAQSPFGIVTHARFISQGEDCYKTNHDYKARSFVNIMYAFLTTDYKEDQLQLPEILNRIRNLGLEP